MLFVVGFFFIRSEKVFDVMQNGMDSLGADERNAYVSDFKGFVTYVRDKGFQVYADKVRRIYTPVFSPLDVLLLLQRSFPVGSPCCSRKK